jgi:glyoxylase-like metal-dependent hydrolase (beta-lactamase superfamily II)
MTDQIMPGIYRIEIPLPNNPLKATNSWLIRGEKRNLLVDTGFNTKVSREAMDIGLQELGVKMKNTDLFITHLHADHSGMVNYLAVPESTVWMSKTDGQVVAESRGSFHWNFFNEFLILSGLVDSGVENDFTKHPGYRYASEVYKQFELIEEGFEITVGDYHFRCVATPGHTQGHMCLFDPDKKLLISGDHILGKITPNITAWNFNIDVLGQYLQSLDKIAQMEIDTVLPGHRYVITDCQGRIEELKKHHRTRLDNVLDIVGNASRNTTQVASRMRWDLSFKSWDDFPWGQKLFAAGEAMSHLYHLTQTGELELSFSHDIAWFSRK